MSRRSAILLALASLVLIALGLRFWLARRDEGEGWLDRLDLWPAEDRLELAAASFAALPGWRDDAFEAAVPVFLRSCARFAALPGDAPLDPAWAGTAGHWQAACARASRLAAGDREAARRFFERHFRPYEVRNRRNPFGLFTGYYEPLLHGSRRRGGRYTVPIYTRPPELVMVDLGRFREELAGTRIAGKVVDGSLVPFADRRQIEAGALDGRRLELVWVDDPIDAFFVQVQGSGRVRLAEGGEMRIGYAAQNGHPYVAIGRELILRGEIAREDVSLQSIRAWLEAHPGEAREVMAKNASYVFFQTLEGEGPVGAAGVPLTSGRSLAVDLRHLPLGAPLWLAGRVPPAREGEPDGALRRLLVAQDTGGAIRGIVRGDVFWGFGEEAESLAGRMKHRGRYWVLLPRTVPQPDRLPTKPAGERRAAQRDVQTSGSTSS